MPEASRTNAAIVLRPATLADVPLFDRWDRQPHVISATTDDPVAEIAFEGAYWPDEISAQDEHNQYLIAELNGRPIGAMQMIDPHAESTHYWGEIEPNLRALDIWIGEPDCLSRGFGETIRERRPNQRYARTRRTTCAQPAAVKRRFARAAAMAEPGGQA